jgi:glycosyltransferase involved in cell wall biosynthesis
MSFRAAGEAVSGPDDTRALKQVLWISLMAPYDRVQHAGGQTANYYVKRFAQCDRLDLRVLSFCAEDEVGRLDLDAYGIESRVFVYSSEFREKWARHLLNFESKLNPLNRYSNLLSNHQALCVSREIARLAKEGYRPDVVVLQWTQVAFLVGTVKKHFPSCRVVCVEEDVTFVRLRRESEEAQGLVRGVLGKVRYLRERALELKTLRASDLVSVNNYCDRQVLLDAGIEAQKIFLNTPYFKDMADVERNSLSQSILFFGAMNREENYEAALWFIDNVLDRLRVNHEVQFLVLGGNPPECLRRRASDSVRVLGYVEDTSPYFETSLCLVAPLHRGAGIKVKILEAMSAGMPVLTTRVGIEGIPATDGQDFFLCESPEQYAEAIDALLTDNELPHRVGASARGLMRQTFDTKLGVSRFIEAVLEK